MERVGRIFLNPTNEIKRGMKRLVVLWIQRDIKLRPGLLVPFCPEMPAQRRFAKCFYARFEFLWLLLQDFNIGRDALGLDRSAGWGEIACSRQPQSPIAGAKWNDALHRSLAKRASTDDRRAPMIL